MVWLYIGIIMCMRVVQSVLSKRSATLMPRNMIGYIKYTCFYEGVAAVFAAALFGIEAIRGGGAAHAGETLLYAAVSGAALAVSCMCGKYMLISGTMALNSLFGTAGLLIPTVASIFLYGETLDALQWIAVAVFMAGAALLIFSSKRQYGRFTVKTFFVLLLTLASNGITMLMQKMFGMEVSGGSVSLFSFASFAAGVLLTAVWLPFFELAYRRKRAVAAGCAAMPIPETAAVLDGDGGETPDRTAERGTAADAAAARDGDAEFRLLPADDAGKKLPRRVLLYGVFLAAAVFIINQLATLSTPLVSSVVLFALINGGATIISAVTGAVLFGEKLTLRSIAGIVLGVGALVLLQI